MSDIPDDLLTLLNRLKTDSTRSDSTSDATRVQLLASILAAAQSAGMNPTQTAELIRGLGVTEVGQAAVAQPAVAEPAEPAVVEPAVAEPAVAEPAVAEPAVAEPEKPATVRRPPARPARPKRPIRPVQSPAAIPPRPLKSTSRPSTLQRKSPPAAQAAPGSLPPLPRIGARSDAPAAKTPAVPPDAPQSESDSAPSQSALDAAAQALALSMGSLAETLGSEHKTKPSTQKKSAPNRRFTAQSSVSYVPSMLDVLIDRAPPYKGDWIWRDANIRSPERLTLPALLLKYARAGASVRIECTCGRARAVIIIAKGRLVSARTNLASAQLGEVLVARTRVPPSDQAEARLLRAPRVAAAWAARTGHLTPAMLHEVVVTTIRLNLAMCLQWPGGSFRVFDHQVQPDGGPRLQTLSTLLHVVDAIPVQRALNHLEQFAPNALQAGPHHTEGVVLAWDGICGTLMSARPVPEPLSELLGRLSAPTLDAARRVVLLVESGVLTHGDPVASVGAQEIRRPRPPKPAVGFDCTPLAEQYGLSVDTARSLTEVTLRACLVHVPTTAEATLDELLGLARMAISRDARPAGTTPADRTMLQAFTTAGLTVPDMCEFCARLVTGMAVLGIDLHHFVPRQSVLGVVLYTDRPDAP